jgi:hypothetical protein
MKTIYGYEFLGKVYSPENIETLMSHIEEYLTQDSQDEATITVRYEPCDIDDPVSIIIPEGAGELWGYQIGNGTEQWYPEGDSRIWDVELPCELENDNTTVTVFKLVDCPYCGGEDVVYPYGLRDGNEAGELCDHRGSWTSRDAMGRIEREVF